MERQQPLEQLLPEARLGDKAAAAEIVRRFQPLVWSAARRLAPAVDLIEDLVQEGNLALLTAIHDYRPGSAPFTWYAKRRVYYALLYAIRRRRLTWQREGVSLDALLPDGQLPGALLASAEAGPEEQALSAADREAFWQSWSRLPLRQRQVVVARLQGRTFTAIAGELGIAPSTAKGAWARAVAALKKMLAGQVQTGGSGQSIDEGGREEV